MDDKELVEFWRQQFENYHGAHARFDNGRYVEPMDQTLWVCWIAAKRTQPSVVLPKDYGNGKIEAKIVHERLTAAGIKYTIGE